MSATKLELGPFQELRSSHGEASTFKVSLREAGVMPVRVRARLDFGYGSRDVNDDKAFAQKVVDSLNSHDELQRQCDELRTALLVINGISLSTYEGSAAFARALVLAGETARAAIENTEAKR